METITSKFDRKAVPESPVESEFARGFLRETQDFSLVLGGPLFQLLRRSHLSDDALELVRRRMLAICTIAWLPLLVLSALEGQVLGSKVAVPFLHDFEVNVRFLIALPLLIYLDVLGGRDLNQNRI